MNNTPAFAVLFFLPMFSHLSGIVHKLAPPQVAIDIQGAGYLLTVPHPLWDELVEGGTATVMVHTYVREDRLDLFGFRGEQDRTFFSMLLNLSGIGPKTALEICSIPKRVLSLAIANDDARTLTQIKGVGRKTAEKLLLDLKALYEKDPASWQSEHPEAMPSAFDQDALEALLSLGYEQRDAVEALSNLPADFTQTEERVRETLRSLSQRHRTKTAKAKMSR